VTASNFDIIRIDSDKKRAVHVIIIQVFLHHSHLDDPSERPIQHLRTLYFFVFVLLLRRAPPTSSSPTACPFASSFPRFPFCG
jgi:hypothetical protein